MGTVARISLTLAGSILSPVFLAGACAGDDSSGAGGSSGSPTGGTGGAAGSATGGSAGVSGSGTTGGGTSRDGSADTAGGGAGGKAGSGGGGAGTSGGGGVGGRGGAAGSAGSGGTAGSAGSGGIGGSSGTSGTGGAGADAGPTCGSLDPAGTAMCGTANTCQISTCGPPVQYTCAPAGAGVESSACMTSLNCAAGLTCLAYGGALNFCKKYCAVDSDCGAGFLCNGQLEACAGAVKARYCEKSCTDPATTGSADCQAGFKCSFFCSGMATALECTPAGTATSGTCAGENDCARGYTCLARTGTDGGVTASCVQYCSPTVPCTTGACTGTFGCGGVANGYRFCQ
jgi:hypothetical protein